MFYTCNLTEYERKRFHIVLCNEIDKRMIQEHLNLSEDRIEQIKVISRIYNNKLSESEGKISDIMHYIEFNQLNKDEAFKICNMLHEIVLDRRYNKDMISMLQSLKSLNEDNKISNRIKSVKDNIKKMDNRKYTPKQLPELFE